MSIRIKRFEWDKYNVGHLQKAHPHYDLKLLEEIVWEAKNYLNFGYDPYGKKVYGARRGHLVVLFNLKANQTARIFSVRER